MDKIFVIDDEIYTLEFFSGLLSDEYELFKFRSPTEALKKIDKIYPDLIICDNLMPELSGFELLDIINKEYPDITFIMMTAYGSIDIAVEAIKKGAFDFITKPFDNIEELNIKIKKAIENSKLKTDLKVLQKNINELYGISNIIAHSKKMEDLLGIVKKIATVNSNVLLIGESGTGKELIARAIHNLSNRSKNRFLAINCAAIPETLEESLFFGYEKGAFTGADTSKKGYFEEANHGTIFLDEIGEASLSLQTKLLRVIQERNIKRLGSSEPIDVDVRIISATNRDLAKEVDLKQFRNDLYYRINVITIKIPPLRDRIEDIPYLAEFFVKKFCKEFNKIQMKISPEFMKLLYSYDWPGNVRELENLIEKAVALSDGDLLKADIIKDHIVGNPELKSDVIDYKTAKLHFERDYLNRILMITGNNIQMASKLAGLDPATIHRKLAKIKNV
ncbi:sigma-54-dependent transcriptional regulator [Calditerrivibrio nitroreducens]|uniref:Putative two component, sigma54 specific, transcriptional regulator n=1 Tax=Calditerrivibrio nitroreducens (strain DSM 19672 / NBRC 101217 / Yu37-1) TaxID=768670 RepID=E4TFV2_CALNY|nr:sigma-54 dependent transcriptional regulator [Calditerrivibrio nitroreducens]ADR19608.1 putative two component, sigma54 specific, transcriptional regulator [Calditerrivibrio nitroreducens DSM 19672]